MNVSGAQSPSADSATATQIAITWGVRNVMVRTTDWEGEQRTLLQTRLEAHDEFLRLQPCSSPVSSDDVAAFIEASERSDEAGRRLTEFLRIRLREDPTWQPLMM